MMISLVTLSHPQVYQANYEAGLRVLELNEADGTLVELAYFDVHPTSTEANFNGAWSNYPWLAGSKCLCLMLCFTW